MNNIERSVAEKASISSGEIISNITQLCKSIGSVIEGLHTNKRRLSWKIFVAATLSGILSSFIMVLILMSIDVTPFGRG